MRLYERDLYLTSIRKSWELELRAYEAAACSWFEFIVCAWKMSRNPYTKYRNIAPATIRIKSD